MGGCAPPPLWPQCLAFCLNIIIHSFHHRSKPLSVILPRKIRRYAVADRPLFAAVGSMRWGSVTFAEMERLGRLFWCQLEATSSSLWMMSGILAMLKRHCFNPSTPGFFHTAIASISVSLAFSGACGGVVVGVPSLYASGVSPDAFVGPDSGAAETHALSHPGSVTGLFDDPLLTSWLLRLRRLPSFPPPWLCLRLCPPAPVPSLWLRPRRLSPVLLATVPSGAAVWAALCGVLALWRPQVLQGW